MLPLYSNTTKGSEKVTLEKKKIKKSSTLNMTPITWDLFIYVAIAKNVGKMKPMVFRLLKFNNPFLDY